MRVNDISKRIVSTILCITIIVLTGCNSEGKKENIKHEALSLCNGKSYISNEFFDKMKEKYPKINFEVTNFSGNNISGYSRETLEHGDIPDIYISTQAFSKDAQKKYLLDLSGYKFINNYSTSSLNEVEVDGGIYLLPMNMQMTGISYNKTLMEQNGWEVPNSFEELKKLAPKIKAKGYDVMRAAFGLDGYPFNYFFNIGNTKYFSTAEGEKWKEDFITGKEKAAGNKELLSSAKYFKKWVDEGFIKTSEIGLGREPEEAFMNGECVFFLSLGLLEYEHTTEDGVTYEYGVMPWLSEDGNSNMLVCSPSRYIGINKELATKGNEQKLKDALKVMEFLSTKEGQDALVSDHANSWLYSTSLVDSNMDKKNPFYSMKDLIEQGNVVNLVYTGWEDYVVTMAGEIKSFITGDITAKELLKGFDNCYKEAKKEKGKDVLAKAKHNMTIEDAARICGIGEAKAVGADVALVSHGGYNREEANEYGVNWYIYKGNIDYEVLNIFRTKCETLSVIEMKGSDIKKLVEKGFDLYGDGNSFKYSVYAKDDKEIKDNKVYKVVAGTEELTKDIQKKAKVVEISTKDAIAEYVKTLGEFEASDIKW